jgi:hypothetical protein
LGNRDATAAAGAYNEVDLDDF